MEKLMLELAKDLCDMRDIIPRHRRKFERMDSPAAEKIEKELFTIETAIERIYDIIHEEDEKRTM